MIRNLTLARWSVWRRQVPADVLFWLEALLLALAAFQAARLFWALVTPVGPLGDWRPAAPQALPPALQAALLTSFDPFSRNAAGAVAASPAALPSDLVLFGTRAGPDGSAIIGKAGGEQKSYAVGEEVAPGVRLAGVLFDRVVLDRGGSRSELLMPSSDGASGPEMAGASASGGAAQGGQLLDLRPRQSGTQVTGVLVAPGFNPAIFQAAGFQPGDVILAVNGAKITSMIDIQQLQGSIVPGSRLTLSVERGGQTVPLAINVPAAP